MVRPSCQPGDAGPDWSADRREARREQLPLRLQPGSPDDDDKPAPGAGDQPTDPFAALFGGGGDIGAAFPQLGQLLSYQGGPVNWDLARDVARQAVAAAGDRSVATAEREQVLDAMRLAELWLDEATAFPAGTSP